MKRRSERARGAILRILAESGEPVGAARIAAGLLAMGIDLQPRTIRFHLQQTDDEGLTELVSRRRGRQLTARGRNEASGLNVMEKVGFVAARVDTLGYRMSFRVGSGQGTVIVNLSLMEPADYNRALVELQSILTGRLAMGTRLVSARAGDTLAGHRIPEGAVAIATVCSVTVNGVMLHEGIPVTARFGGLLEIRDRKPARFVELIEYRGTTLDPLEVFIKADMTDVRGVVRTGNGMIGASFREVPAVAIDDVRRIETATRRYGLGGVLAIGKPGQPLFGVPVSEGHVGFIVTGGLNPIAALHEAGYRISNRSLAGLEDYARLLTIDELRRKAWKQYAEAAGSSSD